VAPHETKLAMGFKLGRKERLIATITISFAFFIAEIAGMFVSFALFSNRKLPNIY
jgi:hypothetical protein